MSNKIINKLFLEGIDLHHATDTYIAFTLNGWKYVEVPIQYTNSAASILNYLKY